MENSLSRRGFLANAATAGPLAAFSFEERALLAWMDRKPAAPPAAGPAGEMPRGKIGKLEVSRLIVGGNLTSGNAHSRDLLYVSSLVRRYFTDDKIFETWALCEECGINTAILRLDGQVLRLLDLYRRERSGKIQWIVQIKPARRDVEGFKEDVRKAIDHGAVGAYVQGSVADEFVREGRVGLIGEALQVIKDAGIVAGLGAHCLEVPAACEKAGFGPDFYMKTLHSANYPSFNPRGVKWEPFHPISRASTDNVWCTNPEETVEFMRKVDRPWVAFKVLAAGAIPPKDGFRYAFENGADFVCAGIFDFQVKEDARLAREILGGRLDRHRPWRG